MLKEMLKKNEGLRLKAYKDSVGVWTIGYGRNIQAMIITEELADKWLDEDIKTATENVKKNIPFFNSLDEVRQSVLINMAFNLGIAGLLKFKNTLALIESSKYQEAAQAMLQSLWARQVGMMPGQRAYVLSKMMETGKWPS